MIAPSAIEFDEELGITACSEPIPIPIPTLVSEPAQAEHTRASIRARDGPEPKVGMTVAVKYDDGEWYEGQIGKVIGARKGKGGADAEGKSRKRKRMFIEYEDGDSEWEEWPGEEIKVRDERSAAAAAASVKTPAPRPLLTSVQEAGQRPQGASGFYGVTAHGNRWPAKINYGGKRHHLGSFATREQAAHAYDEAARKHREDLPLNFATSALGSAAAQQAAAQAAPAQPRGASGFYGVYVHGNRWQARIRYGSEQHYLGSFATREQAAHTYDEAARKHKKDSPLNFATSALGAAAAQQAAAQAAPAQPRGASGFYGVYVHGNRWQARIRYGSEQHYLGSFATREQAAHTYDEAARKHREDLPLNFVCAAVGAAAAARPEAKHDEAAAKKRKRNRGWCQHSHPLTPTPAPAPARAPASAPAPALPSAGSRLAYNFNNIFYVATVIKVHARTPRWMFCRFDDGDEMWVDVRRDNEGEAWTRGKLPFSVETTPNYDSDG